MAVEGPRGDPGVTVTVNARDRDWVDILGTGAVIAAAFLLLFGVLLVVDRHSQRRADLKSECLSHDWIWYEGQCVPPWRAS